MYLNVVRDGLKQRWQTFVERPRIVASRRRFPPQIRFLQDRLSRRGYLGLLTISMHQQPCDDRVGDRNLVNVPPLQFGEEVLWVHSARLDEALVAGRTLR